MTAFGTRLRHLRLRHGLTQSGLAETSGLGQSTISSLETGRQRPWPSTRLALARAFQLSPASFDEAIAGASSPALPAPDAAPSAFASAKVLELLDALGRGEAALARLDALANVVALLWIADTDHRVLAAAGPLADRTPDPTLLTVATLLGQPTIPAAVQRAASGAATSAHIAIEGQAYLIAADPHPEGTSGVALRWDSRTDSDNA